MAQNQIPGLESGGGPISLIKWDEKKEYPLEVKTAVIPKLSWRQRDVIGVEVASSAIKAVELKCKGREISLLKMASVATPGGAVVQGELVSAERALPALRQLVEEYGWKGRKAAAVLAGRQVVTRHIRMPLMPEKELEEAVKWEAEKYLPTGDKEMILDYLNLGEIATEDGVQLGIFLAAAPRKLAELYHGLFESAGIKLLSLELKPLALARWLTVLGEEGSVAIVDIGSETSEIAIYRQQQLGFTRVVGFGGRQLQENLAQTMNLSQEEVASTLAQGLIEQGVHQEGFRTEEIGFNLRDALEGLVREVRRSLDFQRTQAQGSAVEKVFLTGGTSGLPGLEGILTSEFEIPVRQIWSPGELEQLGTEYAVAAGLALRRRGVKSINLLPSGYSVQEGLRWKKYLPAAVALGVPLLLLGSGLWLKTQTSNLEERLQELKAQQVSLQQTQVSLQHDQEETKNLQEQIAVLEKLSVKSISWRQVLQEISASLPQDVWLEQITGDTERIQISGNSSEVREIGVFTIQLNKLSFLREVNLVKMEKYSGSDKTITEFELIGYFK